MLISFGAKSSHIAHFLSAFKYLINNYLRHYSVTKNPTNQ
jgi:hypothetical protein